MTSYFDDFSSIETSDNILNELLWADIDNSKFVRKLTNLMGAKYYMISRDLIEITKVKIETDSILNIIMTK